MTDSSTDRLVSAGKDAARVVWSRTLAAIVGADTSLRQRLTRTAHRAGLPTRTDVRRLTAGVRDLNRTIDGLR